MAELREVPTDELLSFQDYPSTHNVVNSGNSYSGAQINIDISPEKTIPYNFEKGDGDVPRLDDGSSDINDASTKSFWSVEYFQTFFNVDTKDVVNRIIGSVFPRRDNVLRSEMKLRPDLYGPFWISITLIFTIAISGNIANYLQHANAQYHWKYDFHLVSYAATTIFLYISVIPLGLWAIFKWSANENIEDDWDVLPKALELICIYGYSLFIYIPISILWTIQVGWLQWFLVLFAACVSGSVLLSTLASPLNISRHKYVISLVIIVLHLLLAAGFMMFFFHVPLPTINVVPIATTSNNTKL